MNEVFSVLRQNPVVGFATVDEHGNPQARAFQVMLIEDGKIYFCTGSGKCVYQQMQTHPYVAFTVTSPQYVSVRVEGATTFVDDLALKERILEKNPTVKAIYQSADNPEFKIFYLEHGKSEIFDLSTLPPKRQNFTF